MAEQNNLIKIRERNFQTILRNLLNVTDINSLINFDINYCDIYRNNFLYYAIVNNNLELTIYLINNCNLEHLFSFNKNILHILSSDITTNLDILYLIELIYNICPNLINRQDIYGSLPLGYALGKLYELENEKKQLINNNEINNILLLELDNLINKWIQIIKFLINKTTVINAINLNNMSCLYYLCSYFEEKYTELFNAMLEKNANIYISYGYYSNIFQVCIYSNKKIYCDLLLQKIIQDNRLDIIKHYDYIMIQKDENLFALYNSEISNKANNLCNNIYNYCNINIELQICNNIIKFMYF